MPKKTKMTDEQVFNRWADRTAKEFVANGGNKGVRFIRPMKDNIPMQVLAKKLNKVARRKIN